MPFFSPEFWMTVLVGFFLLVMGTPVLYFVYQYDFKLFVLASVAWTVVFFAMAGAIFGGVGSSLSAESMIVMPQYCYRKYGWLEKVSSFNLDRVWVYYPVASCFPGVEEQDWSYHYWWWYIFQDMKLQAVWGGSSSQAPSIQVPVMQTPSIRVPVVQSSGGLTIPIGLGLIMGVFLGIWAAFK